jgi:hypothetical protein
MLGFNLSNALIGQRPQDPLCNMSFNEWWFHDHLDHPPHPNDIMKLPVGKDAVLELGCVKGATSYYKTDPNGDVRDPNDPNTPCPHSPTTQYHTHGLNDLGGCALAVAYKSDFKDVHPEDLVIFSVNHTCVWTRFTEFQVPAQMPPCPNGKCICSFNWIHRPDAGAEQSWFIY